MTFKIMFGFQKIYEKYYSKENGKKKKELIKKKCIFKINKLFLYITLKNQTHLIYFNFNI